MNVPGTIILACFITFSAIGQTPYIQWQKCFGGSLSESATKSQPTSDGGYILVGNTISRDGDVTSNNGGTDVWVIKISADGSLQWQKTFGGDNTETANSILQLPGGGYLVLGSTLTQNNGDVSGNHGDMDIWVIRLDVSGNLLWQKCFGGSLADYGESLTASADGGFVISGYTSSNDGQVSGNHGSQDAWVFKMDASGNLLWQKCLGGSSHEGESSIVNSNDGGYVLAANTTSVNGDVSPGSGNGDFWIVKMTATGVLVWQKSFGGSFGDRPYDITVDAADNIVVTGFVTSSDGNVTNFHGGSDLWVICLDPLGNLRWQTCLGGSGSEAAHDISNTPDGGYVLGGRATSTDGDLCKNAGLTDFWIVKLKSTGVVEWKKTFGGSANDICNSVSVSPDGGYLMAGGTLSTNGDVSGKKGSQDVWAVKLLLEPSVQPTVLITSNLTTVCKGQDILFIASAQNGGSNPIYSWQVNGSSVGTNDDSLILNNLNQGDVIRCVLTSNDRCLLNPSDTSNLISITIDQSLNPKNFLPADIIKCDHETVALQPSTSYSSYLWSNNSTTNFINVTTPGIYWLEVTDTRGCKGRDSILVSRKNDCIKGVFVPTAFTPNKDGLNDSFGPVVNAVMKKYEFSIFNIWGQRIFHSTDPLKKWDGALSSREQNSAVFVWMLSYQIEGDELVNKKGVVTLMR